MRPLPVVAARHSQSDGRNSRALIEPEVIAAVDLGSNSFHMVVATLRHGQLTIIDRLRETVRLAEGLSKKQGLSASAKARALTALELFGDRLRDMRASSVRVAGTNALRKTRDDSGFLQAAEAALGHPIEVISGIEEARLVYLGVAHSLPPFEGRRLVMDIGGGSTELIIGRGFESEELQSLSMGSVMVTETFFPDGVITRERFDAARLMVRLKLRPVKSFFRSTLETQAIGTSGTILAAENMLAAINRLPAGGFTAADVEALIDALLEVGSAADFISPSISERRAEIMPGGLAILVELLATLRIAGLRTSDGALREGLLYDLVGRIQQEDSRVATVAAMARRYHVDLAQAERIAASAENFRLQLADSWGIGSAQSRLLLFWASYLHEIGFDIAHRDFHSHGAYIVENADMPGFPASEQFMLACLLDTQRKSLLTKRVRRLEKRARPFVLRLALLLRLAIVLHRSRSGDALPDIGVSASEDTIELSFPEGWLASTPLTKADLEREALLVADGGFQLSFC